MAAPFGAKIKIPPSKKSFYSDSSIVDNYITLSDNTDAVSKLSLCWMHCNGRWPILQGNPIFARGDVLVLIWLEIYVVFPPQQQWIYGQNSL